MPIKDGSLASQYHSEAQVQVTRRILQKKATSGVRSFDPQESIFGEWANAPRVYLNYHKAGQVLGGFAQGKAMRFINGANLTTTSNVLLIGAGFGWSTEYIKMFMPGATVIGVEPGGWVQSVKSQDERGDIEAALDDARDPTFVETVVGVQGAMRDEFMAELDMGPRSKELLRVDDVLSNQGRNKLKQLGPFSHIVTEHVLEWLWDDEAANLSDAMRQIDNTAQIVHLVTPYSDTAGQKEEPAPMLNWKRIGDATPVDSKLTDQARYIESDWKAVLPNDEFV